MERVVTEGIIYKTAAPGFDGHAYIMHYQNETYLCAGKAGFLLGTKFSDGQLNGDLPLIFYWTRFSTELEWQMLDCLLGPLMGCGRTEEVRVPLGERLLARQFVQSVTSAFSTHGPSVIDQVKIQVGEGCSFIILSNARTWIVVDAFDSAQGFAVTDEGGVYSVLSQLIGAESALKSLFTGVPFRGAGICRVEIDAFPFSTMERIRNWFCDEDLGTQQMNLFG